ncbi:MAG: iron ABC transporter permease [Eggerthellaceae bacterium]|nr:iron ABC transporter permease [Eggerthellaceae bacterium]
MENNERARQLSHEDSRKSGGFDFASVSTKKAALFIICLAVAMVVVSAVSLLVGRFPIDPFVGLQILFSQIFPIEPTWTTQVESIYLNVRLPRIILALLVGCALASAGAAYQGTFQNPLVSPDILGASQGAAFGAALAILLGFSSFALSATAFTFSLATVAMVLLISTRAKGNRILVVVLAGVMMSSLLSAGVSFIKLIADPTNQLPEITYWLMGALNGATMKEVYLAGPIIVVGCAVLFALRWKINILTMGDEEATTMGINVNRTRFVIILCATLVTAASVAVSGMIGWVGLVVPHLCRMVVGADYRKLMPASMLGGATFLLIVDDIARLLSTSEIPIGILTAFVGAPFFLYLITRKKRA